jgi:hypothetical protein
MEADTPKLVSLAEEQVREFGFAQAMRADTTGWNFRQGPPSPAIGIRTVQPMFVYEVMSRRPISTNMLARTGSRKWSGSASAPGTGPKW